MSWADNLSPEDRARGGHNHTETWCGTCHSPLLPGAECDFCAAWDDHDMDLDAMSEGEWLRREIGRGFGWLENGSYHEK